MPSTDETKTPTTGDASVPMDKSSLDKLLEAIQASAAATRVLGSRFDRVEQDLAEVKASQTARTDGVSPAMVFGNPTTPQILRPGIAPGLPSRPGQTPMQATPVARGVSGFFVPITPQRIKDKPEANAPPNAGIGLEGLSFAQGNGAEQSASERISAARLISNSLSEEGQRRKAELWANCLPIVERDNPGASDEEIAAKLDRMVAEQWLQMRRELIMRDFEIAADGKSKMGEKDTEKPAATKKEWQRKISQNAPSRVQNKLTHANYMDWVSEIIGILAPIQGATEILEGIEYGPGYNLADPKSSTDNYELSLDLEIGGLLSGTVTAECRGYVLARQSQGEHRGSILW
ncbi:hypothetical protein OC844_007935 [Tilletia horrida]|nr:hypothetical protein OC844_007935 [Tilletia horrida]